MTGADQVDRHRRGLQVATSRGGVGTALADRGAVRVLVVDGVSTGRDLTDELVRRGASCAHLRTIRDHADLSDDGVRWDLYDATFELAENPRVIDEVKQWDPHAVLPGSEIGVEFTDVLNSRLHLPFANPSDSTGLRRNKYLMHERLRTAGLPSAKQGLVTSGGELSEWLRTSRVDRVVIKPLNSACSDGVTICASWREALAAFNFLYGAVNRLGLRNEGVLVQEHLTGTQYFVNTVSLQRHHYVTDVWQTKRRLGPRARYLFDQMALVEYRAWPESEVADYGLSVLDALELGNGAAHLEIMLTARGPVLIELNARLMGASIDRPSFMRALGHTQAGLLAMAVTDPAQFIRLTGTDYSLREHVVEASFSFHRSGRLAGFPGCASIEALQSFHSIVGVPPVGMNVSETVDTSGLPGFAYLIHREEEVVRSDGAQLLAWQRDDVLFEIKEARQEKMHVRAPV